MELIKTTLREVMVRLTILNIIVMKIRQTISQNHGGTCIVTNFPIFLKNYSSYVIETIYTGVLLIAVLFALKRYIHVRIKL